MRALPISLFPIVLATAACANLGLPGMTPGRPASPAAARGASAPPAEAQAAPAASSAAATTPAPAAPAAVAPVAVVSTPAGPAAVTAGPVAAGSAAGSAPATTSVPAPAIVGSIPATPGTGVVPTPATPRASAAPNYPAPPGNPVVRSGPPDAANAIVLEPGLYRCELSRRVLVRQVAADGRSIVLQWLNKDHTLQSVVSRAGALRYDDAQSGLAWITIPGKSLLLDVKKGQQLANECRL